MLKLIDPVLKAFVLGQARTLAAALGGLLVSDGIIRGDQTNDWIGSVCFLVAATYSAYDKFVVDRKVKEAKAA